MRFSHLIKIKEKRKKNRERGIFFAPNWGLHGSIYCWGLYIMNILEIFPNFRLYYSWFPRFANSLDGHRGSVKPGNSGLWQSQPPPPPHRPPRQWKTDHTTWVYIPCSFWEKQCRFFNHPVRPIIMKGWRRQGQPLNVTAFNDAIIWTETRS